MWSPDSNVDESLALLKNASAPLISACDCDFSQMLGKLNNKCEQHPQLQKPSYLGKAVALVWVVPDPDSLSHKAARM